MKVRTGFVSNSSSSSFIIAYDPKKIKLDKALCLKIIGAKTDLTHVNGWLKDIVEGLADKMHERARGANKYSTIDEAIEEFGCAEDIPDDIKRSIEKGWTAACLYFSDEEGDPYETLLCHSFSCEIDEEHFFAIGDEGY